MWVFVLFCTDVQLSQRYHFMVFLHNAVTAYEDETEGTVQRYLLAVTAVLQKSLTLLLCF